MKIKPQNSKSNFQKKRLFSRIVLSRVVRTLKIPLIDFKCRKYAVLNFLGKIISLGKFSVVKICLATGYKKTFPDISYRFVYMVWVTLKKSYLSIFWKLNFSVFSKKKFVTFYCQGPFFQKLYFGRWDSWKLVHTTLLKFWVVRQLLSIRAVSELILRTW